MNLTQQLTGSRARRVVFAYLIAVIVTYVTASVFQTVSGLAALQAAGANIPAVKWLETVLHDLYGFTFKGYASYGLAVVLGFLIAMPTAALVHKYSRVPGWLLYPLAGATAMIAIMEIVKANFYGVTIFPGTRGFTGYGLQLLAGVLGGALFARLLRRPPEPRPGL